MTNFKWVASTFALIVLVGCGSKAGDSAPKCPNLAGSWSEDGGSESVTIRQSGCESITLIYDEEQEATLLTDGEVHVVDTINTKTKRVLHSSEARMTRHDDHFEAHNLTLDIEGTLRIEDGKLVSTEVYKKNDKTVVRKFSRKS